MQLDLQRDLQRVRLAVREAARIAPGRPALRMGLRSALAVTAPMLIASQLGPSSSTWATLGGFAVVLVDKGGAYRTRAQAMLAATVIGAIGALAGSLAAGSWATLAVTAIGTGLCAMAATWPGPAVAVANIVAWQLIVATTFPHDPTRPWLPAVAYVGGGLWSVVLALFLWPVRVYRPARFAASRCLAAIGQQAAAIAGRPGGPASWREQFARRHRTIRDTLEAARGVLAATRRGRRGEIGRGERLLVIVESTDQVFGVLIAIEEVVDNLSAEAAAAIDGELRAGMTAVAERLAEVADRVMAEGELPELPELAWSVEAGRAAAAELPGAARAEAEHALSLVGRVCSDVSAVTALVDGLSDERDPVLTEAAPVSESSGAAQIAPSALRAAADAPGASRLSQSSLSSASGAFRLPSSPGAASQSGAIPRVTSVSGAMPRLDGGGPGLLDALRGSLTLDSVVLRHALRVAVVSAASVIVTRVFDLQRGYYATLTAVLLLQPYLPATITRGIQRVVGTILGGILATAIVAVVHGPLGIGLASIVFAGVSAAVIQLNYGLYALFLTPTFVLLAEVHAHDTHLVALRISNTLLGAGLAVAGALLLWPSRESVRTADRLANAVESVAGYAREVFAAVANRTPSPSRRVIEARRRAGRALNNAELSLDRLIAEGPAPEILESHMALATMTRRLSATLSAFATARHVGDPTGADPADGKPSPAIDGATKASLTTIAVDAESYLRSAAKSLRARNQPPVYLRHDALAQALPGVLSIRAARIDRQLAILSEAVARVVASAPTA